ncbi:flavin reductase family protein [Parafrankia sp. FMc2]|uniref:flavin reductase family protein n=1 Tax=Parafrankia sp. FMc2 TaxID=3233196 RepID=UPI0034D7B898
MTDQFREVMARLPTGVTIVTARDADGQPHGMTVSAFCSVSLDPPLLLVCLSRTARCFPVLARAGRFAVSILRDRHEPLARRFASGDLDKFGAGGFVATPGNALIVKDALGAVECRAEARHDAGDHVILVGTVLDCFVTDPGAPAVYFDRRFVGIAARPLSLEGGVRAT